MVVDEIGDARRKLFGCAFAGERLDLKLEQRGIVRNALPRQLRSDDALLFELLERGYAVVSKLPLHNL